MSVYSVNVYPSSTTIKTGNWYYGAYAVVDASSNCNTGVTWYSNNTSVATVNASSGYIYAKAPGTARIYAQSTVDSSKKDYITVTVTSGTYAGRADVLKNQSPYSVIWEIKHNNSSNLQLGNAQLNRYIDASNTNSQNFALPLRRGYDLGFYCGLKDINNSSIE